jgi:hypothetical protein
VTLAWTAAATATSYSVKRSASGAAGSFSAVASPTTTSYLDTGLAANTTYWYQVTAANAGGEGAASATVSATTQQGTTPPVGSCAVTLDISNDWGAGQVMAIRLANTGTQALSNWQLSWTESNDFTVTNAWSSVVTSSARTITVRPVDWNATVAAGSSVDLGMQLAYSGARPIPSNVQVQGRDCSIAVVTAR